MAIDTTKLRPYKNSSIPTIDGGMNKYLSTEFQAIAASTKQLVDTLTATAAEADANVTAIGTNTTAIASVAAAVTALSAGTVTTIAGNHGAFTLNAASGITNATNDIKLSQASASQFGAVKVDNTTITAAAGVISAVPTGIAPTPIKTSLSANVALTNTANYFDGPSISLSAGTSWVSGTVTVTDTVSAQVYCKLWDGTNVIASGVVLFGAGIFQTISLSGFITAPTGNVRMSCRNISTTTGNIIFNQSGNSKDSTISAYRIA